MGFNPSSPTINDAFRAAAGEPLPIVLLLGAPLEVVLTAGLTETRPNDELELAARLGYFDLLGAPETGLMVPEAEVIVEGFATTEPQEDGPFGDSIGVYSVKPNNPSFNLAAMWRRSDPVYHFVLGSNSNEHMTLAALKYVHAIDRMRRTNYPEIVGFRVPWYGAHRLAIVRLSDRSRAGEILEQLLDLRVVRVAIAVDVDVNLDDPADLLWAVTTRTFTRQDVRIMEQPQRHGFEIKIGIDATDLDQARIDSIRAFPRGIRG
jgi:UbiD family decarboxylase